MGKAARRRAGVRRGGQPQPATLATLERRARALATAGDTESAIRLYIEAIARGSVSADVFNDLGVLLAAREQIPAAAVQFEMSLALAPNHGEARGNLLAALERMAVTAYQERRWTDAVNGFKRLIQLAPDRAVFHRNLGAAWRELKSPEQAVGHLLQARTLDPDDPLTAFSLGSSLFDLGQSECQGELERCIALDPTFADAYVNLAIVYNRVGQLDRAAATARRALELSPDHVDGHAILAATLREQGETAGGLDHYRRALELRPQSPSLFSGALLAQQGDPAANPAQRLAQHRTWGARFAAPLDPGVNGLTHAPARDPERRLRVGYVSGDLRSHSVASFIEPILGAHDRGVVELYCYSDARPDAVTARIRGQVEGPAGSDAGHWRDTRPLTDQALAEQVIADRIDVLIDLAGHTADNRLLTFARRPAPVQITYCGYPGTTGVAAVGWRLTDGVADPTGEADGHHTEVLWRLPNGFLCFRPDPTAPAPGPGPAASGGPITFGSFNNLSKLNGDTVAVWAELLRRVPDARLFLKARALSDAQPRTRLLNAFAAHGVAAARIETASYAATPGAHIAAYQGMDVALDPFPYNGTTTTCEALWMGVPVVTLLGGAHAGRVGASLLRQIGCPHLIALTPDEYVQLAIKLSSDREGLTTGRTALRARMAASPLTDSTLITRDLENAYRAIWRRYCGVASLDWALT